MMSPMNDLGTVLFNALGWTIFPIFQGKHCRSPPPTSPPFHSLLATPVIPHMILLVTAPIGASPRFPCCMLQSLPHPNHLQDLPPLSPLHILRNNAHPSSPNHPFEFPTNATPLTGTTAPDLNLRPLALRLVELPDFPSVMDSITRVLGSPHVFGLWTDCSLYAQVKRTSATLVDGGANICLTGNLNLLINVFEIPPLPILVSINREEPHIDKSCTQRGYLPLNLLDGSTHWQLCFYCKNGVETIIAPQAILASSEVFASWTQT
jgi:hypothetical protein